MRNHQLITNRLFLSECDTTALVRKICFYGAQSIFWDGKIGLEPFYARREYATRPPATHFGWHWPWLSKWECGLTWSGRRWIEMPRVRRAISRGQTWSRCWWSCGTAREKEKAVMDCFLALAHASYHIKSLNTWIHLHTYSGSLTFFYLWRRRQTYAFVSRTIIFLNLVLVATEVKEDMIAKNRICRGKIYQIRGTIQAKIAK